MATNGEINSNKGGIHLEMEKNTCLEKDREGNNRKEAKPILPFYKLFSFADRLDIFLMITGTIGAIGNGISTPLMAILFGNFTNSFGISSKTGQLIDAVSKVSSTS